MSIIRSGEIYVGAIESFNVEKNPKYLPQNGRTFCNFFAQDVMNSSILLAPLPVGNCATMLNALNKNNFANWRLVDFSTAHENARIGTPTVGITSDHIVVVRPEGLSRNISQLIIAMSGYKCFNKIGINYAWRASSLNTVKFFSFLD